MLGSFTLRDYQVHAVAAFWDAVRTKDETSPLLALPTGSGKTVVISEILRGISEIGYRAIVLTRSQELVRQNFDKFIQHSPHSDAGIYCSGLSRKDTGKDILFATVQSCFSRAESFGERQLVIVDEAHEIPERDESQYQTFLSGIRIKTPNAILLGLTASPYRTDGGLIHGAGRQFTHVAHSVSLGKLINDGYLTPPRTLTTKSVDLEGVKKSRGDFVKGEVEHRFLSAGDHVTDQIVSAAEQKQTRSVLVFASGVAHAESIRSRIESLGHSVGLVTGETLPLLRETLIDNFGRGSIRFLVNCEVLTTGFDCERIDHIAVCRATESPGLFYQICGRGFRLYEGKEVCWIQDFGGNIDRHGPIDSESYGINTIKVKSQEGIAPQKACPKCFGVLHLSAKVCPKCGFEFPENLNIESASSRLAILATPRWYDVEQIDYKVWAGKGGKPNTLRVSYTCSIDGNLLERKVVSEWVCIEHLGYARSMALSWWVARSRLPMPETIEDALEQISNGGGVASAKRIQIHRDGAYDRIDAAEIDEIPAVCYERDDIPF